MYIDSSDVYQQINHGFDTSVSLRLKGLYKKNRSRLKKHGFSACLYILQGIRFTSFQLLSLMFSPIWGAGCY